METVRIYHLARELGRSPQSLLSFVVGLDRGIDADSIMSHLSMEDAEFVRASLMSGEASVAEGADVFGELRGVLDAAPGAEVFDEALLKIAMSARAEVFDYARDVFSRWPDRIERRVPGPWLDGFERELREHEELRSSPHAALSLCNALDLHGRGLTVEDVVTFCELEELSGVAHLNLAGIEVWSDAFAGLARHLGGLLTLDLSGCDLGERALRALADPAVFPNLSGLRLRGVAIDQDVFELLLLRDLRELEADASLSGVVSVPTRPDPRPTSMPLGPPSGAPLGALVARLEDPEPRRAAEALRDLYFAARREGVGEEVRSALGEAAERAVLQQTSEVAGMRVSWHPTARFRQLRFLDSVDLPDARPFHRMTGAMDGFVGVFVDPVAFDYATFENILPLDGYFEGAELAFAVEPVSAGVDGLAVFPFAPAPEAREALMGLDGLGVYDVPINDDTRGGRRFVFHAAALSQALTEFVRGALPEDALEGFSHVNPVFRCNRFAPGDDRFHAHLDTPYRDSARGHVSRHTMLLYLTGGRGEPALSVGERELEEIAPMTCVIMDQRLEHEGGPFVEGDKVFLRTELIYEVYAGAPLRHDPSIAALFSKACYMTGESLVFPELRDHRNACYELAARAHWTGQTPPLGPEPWLRKTFRGLRFVTNGYDFWCSASQVSLKEAAVLATLDRMNARVGDATMRELCAAAVVHGDAARPASWVPALLACPPERERGALRRIVDKGALSRLPPQDGEDTCCPFHARGDGFRFEPGNSPAVREALERSLGSMRRYIEEAPVWILGQQVLLDLDRVVVEGDRVFVGADEGLAPVNFAACWNCEESPADFIMTGSASVTLPFMLAPPILFREVGGCYHLRLDLWRNGWWLDARGGTLARPDFADAYSAGVDPWHRTLHAQLTGAGFSTPRWLDDELG